MNLAKKVTSAVRWATALTFLSQLVMWLVTIIVIRILSPEDYGLMAMSMVLVGFAMIVNELGLGSALVQRPNLSDEETRAAHGFIFVLNVGLYVLFSLGAPWIALFFDEPLLASMIRVIALLFPILGLEVVALALLERKLEFKKKASVYLVATVSGAIVSLLFALSGAGVWSLIYGNLWTALVKALGINVSTRRLIVPTMNISAVRPMLGFGGIVASERILWYIHSQADVFLIGKILGKEQLGYYYVALNLASIIYQKTGGLIYEVSLPAFANVQADIANVRQFFVKAMRIVSFVVFPLMFGLAAVSADMVELLLGIKWTAAAPLVLILSLSMPARILGNLFPPALQGIGQPKRSFTNLATAAVVMVPILALAALKDTNTVALAWLTIYPIVLVFVFSHSRVPLGLHWTNAASAVLPPLVGSVVMFSLVYWLGYQLSTIELSIESRLAVSILSGVFFYIVFSLLGLRNQLSELVALIRR